ncbi:hypothetical protein [Streptomyces sp. NPDC053069]|uniref:hypothetical protein n=1 Tax=Streptomyces sp. NPDC053069 TaxID=3365695 RepID=UPI0037D6610B
MAQQSVPVTVLHSAVVLGPVAETWTAHQELVRRSRMWQRVLREREDRYEQAPAVSVRRALKSGLGGRPGAAAIVQRASGRITYLSVRGSGRSQWTGIRSLADLTCLGATAAAPDEPVDVSGLLRPWSGLLAPGSASRLSPTGPYETRLLVCPLSGECESRGWGQSEADSALSAVLGGLKMLAAESCPSGGLLRGKTVGAAGPSELHWLLDGALSLLARVSMVTRRQEVPPPLAWSDATRGFASPACDWQLVFRCVRQLPGSWCTAQLVHRKSGVQAPAEWGCCVEDAARRAVAAARTTGFGSPAEGPPEQCVPSASCLLTELDPASLMQLASSVLQFLRPAGLRVLGTRVLADALLGRPQIAWGPVWFG